MIMDFKDELLAAIARARITVDVPKDEMVELLKLYPEVLRLMIEVLKEPE